MNYPSLKDGDSSVLGQSVFANPYSKHDLKYYPLAPLTHPLHVLTWPSLCGLQSVSKPGEFTFFLCPDNHSLCGLQSVSAPSSVTFFLCPHKSPLCGLQIVSAPGSVAFFPCPDKSLPLWSPESECPLLGYLLSMP